MPHRLTVAGDACSKSLASNIMFCFELILIISPLMRHNFLLSSRTVFMFSIQMASTGPSNTIHLRFESLVECVRNIFANTPSYHSVRSKNQSVCSSFMLLRQCLRCFSSWSLSTFFLFTSGNRSDMMPSKRVMSSGKNLGKLTSLIDLSIRTCSFSFGYLSFSFAAADRTVLTALMP
ncbi:hypothetical protein BpHYR1_019293 [Brachionus plicatilis]|uniref:Uncharacterized protein n=1 Tax=Brachionus plicatilis TaxID=10195 RepID=A0A3M7RHC8_BRAPC|nr:hypothetical protein BpHYR1_019293 [Brachionus plicatilis]